jgi:hypothetical protein
MREFFKGWRRKVGCVTLVVSLLLAGCWIRSFVIRDVVCIPRKYALQIFSSSQGEISWNRHDAASTLKFSWKSEPIDRRTARRKAGFRFNASIWSTPYWPFTVPLTLLSAYLILWNPLKNS